MFSLTSRDEKTWLRMSPGVRSFRSGFRQRTFFNQPEISTTSDSKVMTQIVVFMVFGDLDLDLWLLFTKKKCNVSWVCRIHDKKNNLDRCQTVACRRCDRQTDRQTCRQTNGTDQYTLRKVEDFRKVIIIGYFKFYIAFCLWPWPLTFDFDFDLWTWPSFNVKRQILTYFLWRHFSARSSFYCFIW